MPYSCMLHGFSYDEHCPQCKPKEESNECIMKTIFKDGSAFPGDCVACGAELNEHGVPIYGTKFWQKEQPKMTREECLNALGNVDNGNRPINARESNFVLLKKLEALGLLKFDEPKKEVQTIFELDNERIDFPNGYVKDIAQTYGTIRIEKWPEGLVLWVGGEIKWKSWEKYYKKGDSATVDINGDNFTSHYIIK